MSQTKSKRDSVRKQNTTKNQWTKQKPKLQQIPKVQPATTIARNLMRDFTLVENQMHSSNNKIKDESIDLTSNQKQYSEISVSKDISQCSNSSSHTHLDGIKEQHSISFQLPKSYILAMKGLQEAVQYRDKQIRKLKKILKQQTSQLQQSISLKNQETKDKQITEQKLNQSILENKFLKEMINDLKLQVAENLRLKIQSENRVVQAKKENTKERNEVQKWKKDNEVNIQQKESLREELNRVKVYMTERKAEYDETIRKRNEEHILNFTEASSLKVECSKLRDQHQKDIVEISNLKNQIKSLSESLAIQQQRFRAQALLFQKNQLDKIQFQMAANRQMLRQITFNQNKQQTNQKNKIYIQELGKFNTQTRQKVIKVQPINIQQTKPKQQYKNTSYDQQRSSFQRSKSNAKIERSVSRLRQTNDSQHPQRRELIGQMRQLMRHEKELVSLNYQMQVLEKGMMSDNSASKREQLQKTYSKLRKNIQRKEMEVKEIKNFLDNPLSGTK